MAPKPVPYGSAVAQEDDDRVWAVRSTLMRIKQPDKVMPVSYQPALVEMQWKQDLNAEYLDRKKPPASPFNCTNPGPFTGSKECATCLPQFFPAAMSVDDGQAKAIINEVADSIKADLAFLRATLKKHADFLVSRWNKKPQAKRFSFLTEHTELFDKKWAAIHLLERVGAGDLDREYLGERNLRRVKTHRTADGDFAVCLELHTQESLANSEMRDKTLASHHDSWFLPYLDAETLSEDPTLFLSLLHHRTSNDPEKWLMFDNTNIVLAEHFSIIPNVFNPNCVVAQGPDYGKLVKWNAEKAHRWEIIGFTKAYHLFTAHQKMLNLLSNCVKGLLAEVEAPTTLEVHPKWDGMIAADFSRFKTDFPWSTDFVKPFSEPPRFDAREVAELIASRHRVVLDELELLQTDPQYVQMLSKEICACRFFETWRVEDMMPWLVDCLFLETMHRESYWRQLVAESQLMISCLDVFERKPTTKAKQGLEQAVFIVNDLCIETFAIFEPQVHAGLLVERGFERNSEFKGSAKIKSTNRSFTAKDWFTDDLLYWSMSTLGFDKERPFTMDPAFNFAIIDRLCRTDPKEARRIRQTMLDKLSDMSILSEIITSIQSDTTRDRAVFTQVGKIMKTHDTSPADWIKKINAGHGQALGDTLGPDMHQLYQQSQWPRGKKDLKWLDEATAARACLTQLWEHFKELWVKDLVKAKVSQRLIDEDVKVLSAASNSRHQEELVREKQDILEHVAQSAEAAKSYTQVEVQTVWGKENHHPAALPIRSTPKAPLIPDATNGPQNQVVLYVPPAKIAALPSIQHVKSESLVVFHHMFPVRGAESQRSFSWQDFLSAMTDAGFSILQSQGSAVTLKLDHPADSGVKTIVLHRPHPSPTVNPVMLRRIAKRMEKWFSWHRKMFVERSK
ncbi:unnamed protein product [Aureobasidium uvarum]|uniref:Uncharacterized protein n=1 Tax=Aureobasidium uvarum TaxID=2773716 RepID=A0A9N8KIP8_9PEZI|nr:unnamed protein product [Aureobasidium uvarum]